jgi:hypothetical protein
MITIYYICWIRSFFRSLFFFQIKGTGVDKSFSAHDIFQTELHIQNQYYILSEIRHFLESNSGFHFSRIIQNLRPSKNFFYIIVLNWASSDAKFYPNSKYHMYFSYKLVFIDYKRKSFFHRKKWLIVIRTNWMWWSNSYTWLTIYDLIFAFHGWTYSKLKTAMNAN